MNAKKKCYIWARRNVWKLRTRRNLRCRRALLAGRALRHINRDIRALGGRRAGLLNARLGCRAGRFLGFCLLLLCFLDFCVPRVQPVLEILLALSLLLLWVGRNCVATKGLLGVLKGLVLM